MKFIKQYIEEKYFLQTDGRITLQHVCDDTGLDGVKVCINNVETGLFVSQAEYNEWLESIFNEITSKNDGKLIDKVAPRFKVGDWIVGSNSVCKVVSLNDELSCYMTINVNNEKIKIPYYFDCGPNHMCSYHLWTIRDARDGDVLVYKNGSTEIIMIFKSERDAFHAYTHFHVFDNNYGVNISCVCCIGAHPATKEQREILFAKMKEAGYEWDADKKELKKIEQKPAEKVESKFKVGDWVIVNGKTVEQISKIQGKYYICVDIYGNDLMLSSDCKIHLWTIDDAKDGDVLATEQFILIFRPNKYKNPIDEPRFYCRYDIESGSFKKVDEFATLAIGTKYVPATNEQRDLLFKKMKEAGYEWDADKKEIKRIEQRPLEQSEDKKMRRCISDVVRKYGAEFTSGTVTKETMLAWLEKQGKHKPAIDVPSKELIFAIWDLGNWWKEITKGRITEEYGTQLDYIQKHWHDSKWADHHLEKQDEMDNN